MPTDENAWGEIYQLVRRIPRGKVMNYGQVAEALRRPFSARAVGWAMHQCPKDVPWHRVVNASGGMSTASFSDPPDLQQKLLEQEGVRFNAQGKLDMERYRFRPSRAGKRVAAKKKK